MAKAKKGPVQYQPSHYAPIPMVDWDAPEADRLIAQRDVLHLAKMNMMIAMEAFDLAWRLHEDVERQIAPHHFESNTPTTGARDAYRAPDCRRCFKKRCDPRHGAVPRHPFVPCERSWGAATGAETQWCFECGLKQFDAVHGKRVTTERIMVPYQLPDGQIVQVDDSAAKGAKTIDYTLANGEIVQAVRHS